MARRHMPYGTIPGGYRTFAPYPPHQGKAHLTRTTAPGTTLCGQRTRETRAIYLIFRSDLRFGWGFFQGDPSNYPHPEQYCRSCLANTTR